MKEILELKILQAQNGDKESREHLLEKFRPYIIRVASQICKRQINWSDDEASISLIAINEAIDRYDSSAGKSFENYAYMIIRSRLVDEFRKQGKSQDAEILLLNGNNEIEASTIEIASSLEAFTIEQTTEKLTFELVKYDETLQFYGISLEELEDCSPIHRDTRAQLIRIAKHFVNDPSLVASLLRTKQLPLKDMLKFAKVSRRTLERNRKYIISLILIYSMEDFSTIRQTISFGDIGE